MYKMLKKISLLILIINIIFSCGGESKGQAIYPPANNPSSNVTNNVDAPAAVGTKRILMFVSYNDVWYAEYKVMYEALRANGYSVEVVSSSNTTNYATTYQDDGNILASANSDPSTENYSTFTSSFFQKAGIAWNEDWNTPSTIPLDGRIQDITSLDGYAAFVVPGGKGMIDYLYDGTYAEQIEEASGLHPASALEVQTAAEKFSELVIEALLAGKPVLTQCHGAKNVAYVRSPSAVGGGFDGLGISLMEGRRATGFHQDAEDPDLQDGETGEAYGFLGVDYLPFRRVVIDGPSPSHLNNFTSGMSRVITTRDWYPQTVLTASKALMNVIETFPNELDTQQSVSVLIIHGGALNTSNCGAGNQTTNDVPCNFPPAVPADYLDLQTLLSSDTPDAFTFIVSDININANSHGSLPFDMNNQIAIESYLEEFDTVVFYKHWSNGITDALQNALIKYADNGNGLVSIHHGLYNQFPAKDILVSAFEVQSSSYGWGSVDPSDEEVSSLSLLSLNQGHFVSAYQLNYDATTQSAALPILPADPNAALWGYPAVSITDEVYTNTAYEVSAIFGENVGEVNVLFANNYIAAQAQTKTAGMVKFFDPSGDGSVGRLAYFQFGERKENYIVDSFYGQVLRNAVFWSSQKGIVSSVVE